MVSNQKGKGPMHYPCCRCNAYPRSALAGYSTHSALSHYLPLSSVTDDHQGCGKPLVGNCLSRSWRNN